jgi:hypothetical protein
MRPLQYTIILKIEILIALTVGNRRNATRTSLNAKAVRQVDFEGTIGHSSIYFDG